MSRLGRILDIAISVPAAVVLLPIVLGLALLIAVTTGTPVFFLQWRAGLDGLPFRLIKLRTMSDARDAEDRLLPDAARVTGLGRVLRRTRLDELPELVNIIKGEMSIVGPRPLLPATIVQYGAAGGRRCAVRPGLTGWAQVNGNTLLSEVDKIALDLWYIDHRSLTMDIQIVLRTIAVVILGERIPRANSDAARRYARMRYQLG